MIVCSACFILLFVHVIFCFCESRHKSPIYKLASEMTIEELRAELLTSDKVDLPNRRAFYEAQRLQPADVIGMCDVDGLKTFNDMYSYEAGDELLRAIAFALRKAGIEAYHDKGDEFLCRGYNLYNLTSALEIARQYLHEQIITVRAINGTITQLVGADFSYGVGDSLNQAEQLLKIHKAQRKHAAERGTLGIMYQIAHEAKQEYCGTP